MSPASTRPPPASIASPRLLGIRATTPEILVAFLNDRNLASRIVSIIPDQSGPPAYPEAVVAFVRATPAEAREAIQTAAPPLLLVFGAE